MIFTSPLFQKDVSSVTLAKLPKIVAEFEARFIQKEIFDNPLNFPKDSLSCVKLAL